LKTTALNQWFPNDCHVAHYRRNFNFWAAICSKEELGRKSCGKNFKFLLFVYSTHKKLHGEVGLDGNVCSTQEPAASTAVTDIRKESVW